MTTLKRGVYEQKGTIGKFKRQKKFAPPVQIVFIPGHWKEYNGLLDALILPLLGLPLHRFVIVFRILMGILHRTVERTIWI